MNTVRQKRQSCEACRARKLKCSGEKSGCSRCLGLSLACRFQEKRRPGRPRKAQQGAEKEKQRQREWQKQKHSGNYEPLNETSQIPLPSCSRPSSAISQVSTKSPEVETVLTGRCDISFPPGRSENDLDLGPFSAEMFGPCYIGDAHVRDIPHTSLEASNSSGLSPPSCGCARNVADYVRSLSRGSLSHNTIHDLRGGTDTVESLLTCPICYDLTKPPRITIQNVLLIGRLVLEITSGYHRYLRWLKESCKKVAGDDQTETVYFIPGIEISPVLSFEISGQKFQDLVTHGLQADAERLSALGKKFAQRQHDRHMIGHEACPSAEGGCWREEYDFDIDPLQVCPRNSAAKSLTPCYRVVEEVLTMIKQLVEAVAC